MNADETALSTLEEQAERLPTEPGVYLFKSEQGTVLYVGKAQNLKSRVRQYVSCSPGASSDAAAAIVASARTASSGAEKTSAKRLPATSSAALIR